MSYRRLDPIAQRQGSGELDATTRSGPAVPIDAAQLERLIRAVERLATAVERSSNFR